MINIRDAIYYTYQIYQITDNSIQNLSLAKTLCYYSLTHFERLLNSMQKVETYL